MSNKQFVGLHVHTHHSILDGFSTINELLDEVERLGQTAVGITDHGSLTGVYELYSQAKKRGIKPVLGIEAYMAPSVGTHTDHKPLFFGDGSSRDDVSSRGAYTHILLFAKNNTGLKNLFKMNYLAHTEGYFRKPRISVEMLKQYHEGLIGTTGCPSGEIQTRLRLGQYAEALEHARTMQNIFGQENYYCELMDHDMEEDLERRVRDDLLRISQTLNIPLIATNDNHYTTKDEAYYHEVQLCISTHSTMDVPTSRAEGEGGKTRFAFSGDGYYLKSYDEMAKLFPEDKYPGALSNTQKIADMCDVSIEYNPSLRPIVPLPDNHTEASYLREQAFEGLKHRLPDKAGDETYIDRLNRELDVIISKDYANYFLVVSDFTRWCKYTAEPRVPVGPGRGSAGGSLLAFVLDITDIDPIKFDLIFERFINPERDSPPDIDMDFNDLDRGRVIEYVKDKYGEELVSSIITFGYMKAKSAVKDTIRVLGLPFSLGDMLTKAMPEPVFGKDMPLHHMVTAGSPRYDEAAEFRRVVQENNAEQVVSIARKLEGRIRNTGVHAAGILVSSEPIVNNVPVSMRQADGEFIAQWDYPTCEALGLLKIDFLGLRNLGIISKTVKAIKKTRNVDLDVTELILGDMDDPAVYRLLSQGNTGGLFQVEGSGMKDLLRLMKPTNINDISAALALYRPGPMGSGTHTAYALRKNGLEDKNYIHPDLKEVSDTVLADTHMTLLFQEQVMRLAQLVSGYTAAQADNLRRAMGKKKKEILDEEWGPFYEGAKKNGYSDASIKALWDVLVPFADYSFNKSHSLGYALITYTTSYLKAHYLAEYMTSVLDSVADDTDRTAIYLEDAKQNKLTVLQPDINNSKKDYITLDEKTILFGFKAIKGMGAAVSDFIVEERQKGKFKDFSDFINRVDKSVINRRVLEALAYAGAFDSMGHTRKSIIDSLPSIFDEYRKNIKLRQKQETMGEDLFSLLGEDVVDEYAPTYKIFPADEYPPQVKLKNEKTVLGLYVSAHPLDSLDLKGAGQTHNIAEATRGGLPVVSGFVRRGEEPKVSFAGLISSFVVRTSKAGNRFGLGVIEDKTGSMEFLMFKEALDVYATIIEPDAIAVVTGYVQERNGQMSMIASSVKPLEFSSAGKLPVRFKVTSGQWAQGEDEFRGIVSEYISPNQAEGKEVLVGVRKPNGEVEEVKLDYRVVTDSAMISRVRELFGVACIGRW